MTTAPGLTGHELIKGHGTENDFLMLVDPERRVPVSAADVTAVCDRPGRPAGWPRTSSRGSVATLGSIGSTSASTREGDGCPANANA